MSQGVKRGVRGVSQGSRGPGVPGVKRGARGVPGGKGSPRDPRGFEGDVGGVPGVPWGARDIPGGLSPSLRLGKVFFPFNSQIVLGKTFLSKRFFGNNSFFKVNSPVHLKRVWFGLMESF